MPLPVTHFLADHDGTLHVAAKSADWSEPRYVVNYFPTNRRTHEFCRFFEITPEQLRDTFTLRQVLPGSFEIVEVKGQRFAPNAKFPEINLAEYGKTKNTATGFEPVPVPKVKSGTRCEWESGRWRIIPPKGKVRIVEV